MSSEKTPARSSSAKYQYLAAAIVNLFTLTYGFSCGWPGPWMEVLRSKDTPLPSEPLTIDQTSWIAGLVCIGGIIGNIAFGYAMDLLGRKKSLLALAIPATVGWFLMLFAQNAYYLYGTRVLCGILGGGVFVVTPTYLAEIANDQVRGALSSTLILSCNIGITIAFILGYYCSFSWTPHAALFVTVAFVILFFYLPETPIFLVKNDRLSEAEASIQFYSNLNPSDGDSLETIQMEIKKLKSMCKDASAKECSTSLSWSDFKTPEARKAFMIGFVLVTLNQFSGVFAVLTYSDTILKEAVQDMSPAYAAIFISILQVFGAYMPTIFADRAGRKFLLVLSSIGVALGMSVLGAYSVFKPADTSANPWLSFIPLCSLSFIIFVGSCGVVSLPAVVIIELLPEKLKSFGLSFLMAVMWAFCLIVLKFLPFIMAAIGIHGATFVFAIVCIFSAIFMILVMPETMGKSYEEIMAALRR